MTEIVEFLVDVESFTLPNWQNINQLDSTWGGGTLVFVTFTSKIDKDKAHKFNFVSRLYHI